MKPNNLEDTDWAEMKEKAARLIHLYVSDKVVYHILDVIIMKKV